MAKFKNNNLLLKTNQKIFLGSSNEAEIKYDGADLLIDSSVKIPEHVAIGNQAEVDQFGLKVLGINENFTTGDGGFGLSINVNSSVNSGTAWTGSIAAITQTATTLHSIVQGAFLFANCTGDGVTVADLIGVKGGISVPADNGSITNAMGGWFVAGTGFSMSNTAFTNMMGGRFQILDFGSGDIDITNGYGVLVESPGYTPTGTLTNLYGVHVQDQSGSGFTNHFNIFSAGAGSENKFEGNVEVEGTLSTDTISPVDSTGVTFLGDIICDDLFTSGDTIHVGDGKIKSTNGNVELYSSDDEPALKTIPNGVQIFDVNGNYCDVTMLNTAMFLRNNSGNAIEFKTVGNVTAAFLSKQYGYFSVFSPDTANSISIQATNTESLIKANEETDLILQVKYGPQQSDYYDAIKMISNGGVELNHAGNQVFETDTTGVIITGDVTITQSPTLSDHAATKGYVDSKISTGVTINAEWQFDDATGASDPGGGKFRMNNTTQSAVTALYINDEDKQGVDMGYMIGNLETGDAVFIQERETSSRAVLFRCTGNATDNGGWWTVPVAVEDSNAEIQDGSECAFYFAYIGEPQNLSHTALVDVGAPQDDHTQYAHIDGRRAFTGNVTIEADLTVEGNLYADTLIPIDATAGITVAGNLNADFFIGDGSQLTNIPTELIQDLTPQLGGDLDSNSNDINMRSGGTNDAVRFVYDPDGSNTLQGSLESGGSGSLDMYLKSQGQLNLRYNDGATDYTLRLNTNGLIEIVGVTDYETLVTDDDDIPNKKYVDDLLGVPTQIVQGDSAVSVVDDGTAAGYVEIVADGEQVAYFDAQAASVRIGKSSGAFRTTYTDTSYKVDAPSNATVIQANSDQVRLGASSTDFVVDHVSDYMNGRVNGNILLSISASTQRLGAATGAGKVDVGASTVALSNAGVKMFETKSDGAIVFDEFSAPSLEFRDGADNQISRIYNTSGEAYFQRYNGSGWDGGVKINSNSGTELYHGNIQILATDSTGATLVGTMSADFFVGDGSQLTNLPGSSSNEISQGDSNVTVTDAGTGTIDMDIDGEQGFLLNANGWRLGETGAGHNYIIGNHIAGSIDVYVDNANVLSMYDFQQTLGTNSDSRIVVSQSSNKIDFYGGNTRSFSVHGTFVEVNTIIVGMDEDLTIRNDNRTVGEALGSMTVTAGYVSLFSAEVVGQNVNIIGGEHQGQSGSVTGGKVVITGGAATDSGLTSGIGGDVEIEGGSGYTQNGKVKLLQDGSTILETDSTGITVYGNITCDDVFTAGSTVYLGADKKLDTDGLHYLDGDTWKLSIALATFGPAWLYYDGNKAISTDSNGAIVWHPTSNSPTISFQNSSGSLYHKIVGSSTDLVIENHRHSGHIIFKSDDSGGTVHTLIDGNPDSSVDLYFDGSKRAETSNFGINLYAASQPSLGFYDNGAAAITGWVFMNNDDDLLLQPVGGSVIIDADEENGHFIENRWGNDGTKRTYHFGTSFYPTPTNGLSCGKAGNLWTDVYATSGSVNTSDGRKKENIIDSDLGLEFINNLKPISYKLKDEDYYEVLPDGTSTVHVLNTYERTHYGMIAQDVKDALDNIGKDSDHFGGYIYDEEADFYGLRYHEFIAPIIKAIQELGEDRTVHFVTGDSTAASGITIVNSDTSATIELVAYVNAKVTIKNVSTNTVTVQGSGTIDGQSSYTLSSQYESLTVVCDGTNWYII